MKAMTFIQVLESEFYYLVEALEHGSSDKQLMLSYAQELFDKTGYKWVF